MADNVYEAIHGKPNSSLVGTISIRVFGSSNKIVNAIDISDNKAFYLNEISNGDWLELKNVDLSQNKRRIAFKTMVTNTALAGNIQVEVRMDSLTGELIGQGTIRNEASWIETKFFNQLVSGVHDIYLKFTYPTLTVNT